MLRTVLAVLLGWALVGGLVVCTDLVLMKMFPNDYVEGRIPPDSLALLSLGTGALWSVIGGWFCALIAKIRIWRHAIYLMVWGEIMGAVSTVMAWGRIQAWYQIGLLVAWPIAVIIGAWIRTRQVPAERH